MENSEQEKGKMEKEKCPHCGEIRLLNEETEACKKCSDNL
jgi:hypothetical protein